MTGCIFLDERNILVIVPARQGSKRLPGKNGLSIGGRSLLRRIADTLDGALPGAAVLFTSDDAALIEQAKELGWHAPFVRPPELSDDTARSVDVVLHALDHWTASRGQEPEAVMLLQVTSPFRSSSLISKAIDAANDDPDTDNVVSVSPLHVDASHVMSCADDGYLMPVSAKPANAFVPNGALYLTRTAALRRSSSFFAGRTRGIATDPVEATDIDTPLDADWARFLEGKAVTPAAPHLVGAIR